MEEKQEGLMEVERVVLLVEGAQAGWRRSKRPWWWAETLSVLVAVLKSAPELKAQVCKTVNNAVVATVTLPA